MAYADVFPSPPSVDEINDYLYEKSRQAARLGGRAVETLGGPLGIPGPILTRGAQALEEGATAAGKAAAPYVRGVREGFDLLQQPEGGKPKRDMPPLPVPAPFPQPEQAPTLEERVRLSLAGAPPNFIDKQIQVPFDPNGPRKLPPPERSNVRAVQLPNGKILLTNLTEAPAGATPLQGEELYNAVKAKTPAMVSRGPQVAADAGVMETPTSRSYGAVDDFGVVQGGMQQNPTYRGAYSQLTPTEDQQAALAIEDAGRATGVYEARARMENARQAAADAGLPAAERAQLTAASRAPQLIAMQAVQQEMEKIQKARVAYNTLAQRMSTPGPDFVEPNQRQLALRMLEDRLGLTGAEERIRILASIAGTQRVPQELLTSLSGQ